MDSNDSASPARPVHSVSLVSLVLDWETMPFSTVCARTVPASQKSRVYAAFIVFSLQLKGVEVSEVRRLFIEAELGGYSAAGLRRLLVHQ